MFSLFLVLFLAVFSYDETKYKQSTNGLECSNQIINLLQRIFVSV